MPAFANTDLNIANDFYRAEVDRDLASAKTRLTEIYNQIPDSKRGDRTYIAAYLALYLGRNPYQDGTGLALLNPQGYSIYSPMAALDGGGVCNAFTIAYREALNMAGIPNIVLAGDKGADGHTWNAIELNDGKWYMVDISAFSKTPFGYNLFFGLHQTDYRDYLNNPRLADNDLGNNPEESRKYLTYGAFADYADSGAKWQVITEANNDVAKALGEKTPFLFLDEKEDGYARMHLRKSRKFGLPPGRTFYYLCVMGHQQFDEILFGLSHGLKAKDIAKYDNPDTPAWQMRQIRIALERETRNAT